MSFWFDKGKMYSLPGSDDRSPPILSQSNAEPGGQKKINNGAGKMKAPLSLLLPFTSVGIYMHNVG